MTQTWYKKMFSQHRIIHIYVCVYTVYVSCLNSLDAASAVAYFTMGKVRHRTYLSVAKVPPSLTPVSV